MPKEKPLTRAQIDRELSLLPELRQTVVMKQHELEMAERRAASEIMLRVSQEAINSTLKQQIKALELQVESLHNAYTVANDYAEKSRKAAKRKARKR